MDGLQPQVETIQTDFLKGKILKTYKISLNTIYKVEGSNPPWRTRLSLVFSIRRLPILEAFVVCLHGQMWTKRDKNRTQVFGRYTWLVSPNKLQEETLPSYVVKSTCFFITSLLLYITSLTGLHPEIVDVSFFPSDADADSMIILIRNIIVDGHGIS